MRAFLIVLVVLVTSCKKEDSKPSYDGLWNTLCDGKTAVMHIDGNKMTHTGLGCIVGVVTFTTSGNSITIPYQKVGDDYHKASGTITNNSISLKYQVTRFGTQLYRFDLIANR